MLSFTGKGSKKLVKFKKLLPESGLTGAVWPKIRIFTNKFCQRAFVALCVVIIFAVGPIIISLFVFEWEVYFFPEHFLPAPIVGLCLSLTALACTSLVEMLMFADVENRDFEVGAWSIFWQDRIGQGSDALWQKSILFSFFVNLLLSLCYLNSLVFCH